MPRIASPSEALAVCLVEGPSKTMKTTVGKAATAALQERGLKVVTRDAGSFFRIVTRAALDKLVLKGVHEPTQTDLDLASQDVLHAQVPFDPERTWDGLHERYIDDMVGKVSKASHVQAASERWWDITADGAVNVGADALIVDGRNPRARLQPWLTRNETGVALELLCECDAGIAAERTVRGSGIEPSASEIATVQRSIIDRRIIDGARPSLPYIPPEVYIDYDPGVSAHELVQQARSDGKPELPLPIRFDTGAFDRDAMGAAVGSLVIAAVL